MLRKSQLPSARGIASARPPSRRTPRGSRAQASIPMLGSTPVTSAGSATSRAASRVTSPVPAPTSTTRIPGASPARASACRRYQEPVPNVNTCSMRS